MSNRTSDHLLESVRMVADGTFGGYQWDLIADLGKEVERLNAEICRLNAELMDALSASDLDNTPLRPAEHDWK